MPKRIQRKRTKGWRMPEGTIYVGRPTIWGNPFEIGVGVTPKLAVEKYVLHLRDYYGWVEDETQRAYYPWPVVSNELETWIKPLKGKDLACWCQVGQPCHADVLLVIANAHH